MEFLSERGKRKGNQNFIGSQPQPRGMTPFSMTVALGQVYLKRAAELREDMSSIRKCLRLHVPGNAELGTVPFIFVTCDAASLAGGFFSINIHFSLSSSKWCVYVDGRDYREICQVHMCNIFESFYLVSCRTE